MSIIHYVALQLDQYWFDSKKLNLIVYEGERCPCSAWVTPAFHVQKAKVDICRTLAVVAGMSAPKSATIPAASPAYCKQTTNCDTPSFTLQPISSPDGLE